MNTISAGVFLEYLPFCLECLENARSIVGNNAKEKLASTYITYHFPIRAHPQVV